MRVYRFDDEVTIPVSQHGSDFALSPLVAPGARVAVSVLYLPAGGMVGEHPTPADQLFAVVAGRGWATGSDGRRRTLETGQAAWWAEGEVHAAGTDTGLTALSVQGQFDVWAVRVTKDIVVTDYDPAWPERFREIADFVGPAVAGIAVRVDHVGSTSVPGLAAKPVIDVDVVVASEGDVARAVEALRGVGYRWRGNLGVPGREAFAVPEDAGLPEHNLYVVVDGSSAQRDHVLLRDLLRSDADARRAYGDLKRRNAEQVDGDIDAYVAAKADLVTALLRKARGEEHGEGPTVPGAQAVRYSGRPPVGGIEDG